MAQIILHPREGRSPKDYALLYIGLGWHIFPVWPISTGVPGGVAGKCACPKAAQGIECDRPGKHPIQDVCPSGVSDATNDRAKVEAWWGRYPHASIGVATGAVSGLTVIDADSAGGKPGVINYTRLVGNRGGMPKTFTSETGGGGLHQFFKYNAGLRTGVNVLDEAIDVRNDGGYIILPPSSHMSGKQYKWRDDRSEFLELPTWMLNTPREAGQEDGEGVASRRGRGRPRVKEGIALEKLQVMLKHVDAEDRDIWLKMGLLLGRMFVGTPGEAEAWALYEEWAARSEKFDEHRAENIRRMREQFDEASQTPPRAGSVPLGVGTLVMWAKEGGWSPFGDRKVVKWAAGNEAEMCSEMIEGLVAGAGNRFFNVGGEVRDVLRAPQASVRNVQESLAEGKAPAEQLIVRKTHSAALQCALSEKVVLATTDKNGMQNARSIPADLAGMIVRDRAKDFPTLAGVVEWPMVLSGQLLMKPRGYDPETWLYFDIDPSVRLKTMSAVEGWAWLKNELLVDFPFEDEVHQAGALGMLLAFMLRPLMKTCPAFAVVAPQPGTGKSTLVEAAAVAVHGGVPAPHAFSTDEEELRKALHSLMLAKVPLVLFDNLPRGRAVSSDHLAKLITSENSMDRVLGASEARREVNSLLITFTGNNIAFVKDMASRVVTLRINAKSENPIGRDFRHPDIKGWARRNRNMVLSCLVAIAGCALGRPAVGRASRFEDYDEMIVHPVMKVTGQDIRVLNTVNDVDAEEDQETREVLKIIWHWQQHYREGDNGKTWRVSEVIAALTARAFSDAQVAQLKRWAGDVRRWDADPTRTVAYALRAVKDDYKFAPLSITSKVDKDGAKWLVSNAGASSDEQRPTQNAF